MEQNTERKTLSKKDVVKSFWRWTFFSHANYNYERLAGTGFCHAMAPIIEKLYKDNPEEYKAAVQRHMEFYNTEPHFGGVINGMVIAMEEERANGAPISDEAINGIKTGLMGPFAGVGDTLVWVLWPTIMGSISGYMAQQGNPLGAIIWFIANIIFWFVKRKMFEVGYTSGTKLITNLGKSLTTFTEAASIMGLSVVGALIASSVKMTTALNFKVGEVSLALQTDILDRIMPSLLPVLLTALVYKLLGNKKWTATKLILLIIVIALVCSFFGILTV